MSYFRFVGLDGIQPPRRSKHLDRKTWQGLSGLIKNEGGEFSARWDLMPDGALAIILSHLEPCDLPHVRASCRSWRFFVDQNLLTIRPKPWGDAGRIGVLFPSLTRLDLTEMSKEEDALKEALVSAATLSSLKRLDLMVPASNGDYRVPDEISSLRKLRIMVIAGDEPGCADCVMFPRSSWHLACLEEVRFKYVVPDFETLKALPKLRYLRLGKPDFGAHSLLENLSSITTLVGLDLLQDRYMTKVPLPVCLMSRLRHLDLSMNRLVKLPMEIGGLTKLTGLVANRNCIVELPESIGNLTNLVRLDLSNNCLTEMPMLITNLCSLRHLDVSSNQLETLPVDPMCLTNLHALKLDFNNIQALGKGIGKMVNLRQLSIQHNALQNIPEEMGLLRKLTHLYLSANQLIALPNTLSGMIRLCHISLDQNCLERLPQCMAQLKHLSSVDLSFNRFNSMPLPLTTRMGLKELCVEYNPFTCLENSI